MATFTMLLCDVYVATAGDIGLNDYAIFNEDYREKLNKKIVDHYWNQEIGVETISMFTFAMRRKMNEIMPYYNKLYDSENLAIDPLNNINVKTVSDGTQVTNSNSENTSQTEGNTNATSNSKSRSVGSTTPQIQLSGNADYASNLADVTGESNNKGTSLQRDRQTGVNTGQSNSESATIVSGNQGDQSTLLSLYRSTFLNIDILIIEELSELFMQIWDSGDSYTTNMQPYRRVY